MSIAALPAVARERLCDCRDKDNKIIDCPADLVSHCVRDLREKEGGRGEGGRNEKRGRKRGREGGREGAVTSGAGVTRPYPIAVWYMSSVSPSIDPSSE